MVRTEMGKEKTYPSSYLAIGGGGLIFILLLSLSWALSERGPVTVLAHGRPERIVSLAPSVTEILFALGLDKEVVGVTEYCDFPPAARTRPKVGGFKGKSLEAILSLSPDLVVGTRDGNEEGLLRALTRLRIPTLTVEPGSLDEVIASVRTIGQAVQREAAAERLARQLEARLWEVRSRVEGARKVRVMLVYGREPLVLAGPGTFADDLIRLAGGVNIAGHARTPYPRFSWETIFAQAPEVIVEGAMGGEATPERREAAQVFWSRWPNLPAVANGRIVVMEQDLIARPGPRLFDGLWQLARALHPERFPESTPSLQQVHGEK